MRTILIALILLSQLSDAAVFNVTNNNDDGPGSLRQAVTDANLAAGADVITFDDSLGNIVLLTGEIVITDELLIDGPTAGQTIDGNNASRIFSVPTGNAPLTLNRMRITQGGRNNVVDEPSCNINALNGGAICTLSNLTLMQSSVEDSFVSLDASVIRGGGLYVGGTLSISDSIVKGNEFYGSYLTPSFGGGIFAVQDVTIINSFITQNRCVGSILCYGGGLYVRQGNLSIENSAFTSNSAAGSDDFNNRPRAGAAFIENGNLRLINSLIYGNSTNAGSISGIRVDSGDAYVVNSTIYKNMFSITRFESSVGPGLSVNGELEMHSSIVARNADEASFPVVNHDCLATELNPASSNNFIQSVYNPSNGFPFTCGIANGVNGNITGVAGLHDEGLNPLLENFAEDNGCAQTAGAPGFDSCVPSVAPLPGSPVIDRGSNVANLPYDQRGVGFPRAIAGLGGNTPIPDIGAYEQIALSANGICGFARFRETHEPPIADLMCIVGNPTTPQVIDERWRWTCLGILGGGSAGCSAEALTAPLNITVTNGQVSCSPSTVFYGDTVTCEAIPQVGFQFSGWTGTCSGLSSTNICNFTYNGDAQLGAIFGDAPLQVPVNSRAALALLTLTIMMLAFLFIRQRFNQ